MLRCRFAIRNVQIVVLLTGMFLSATGLFAQATMAQIEGRITDPSGGAVSGAKVTLTNVDTALKRETTSNDQGAYTVPLLPPGNYSLTVYKTGFKLAIRSGIA